MLSHQSDRIGKGSADKTRRSAAPPPHSISVPPPPGAPMSLLGVLRGPRQVLFGAGQRHALGTVVSALGSRALVCTDARFGATPEFAHLVRLLEDSGVQVTVVRRGRAGRARAPGRPVRRARRGGGARRRRRDGRGQLPRPGQGRRRAADPRRDARRLLRRAQGARTCRAGRRPAHHGGHGVGGDAGGGAHRPRPDQQGGDLQSLPDPARRRLRPGADRRLPAAAHGERGRGRPLPRRRGLHGDPPTGDVRARHRARLRRQERADRHLRAASVSA